MMLLILLYVKIHLLVSQNHGYSVGYLEMLHTVLCKIKETNWNLYGDGKCQSLPHSQEKSL
jgi:hypothetical protein